MDFKNYLMSLHWNEFVTYPKQGEDVYIYGSAKTGHVHKFIKISDFNAISFDYRELTNKFSNEHQWQFYWLPAEQIEQDYDRFYVNWGNGDANPSLPD